MRQQIIAINNTVAEGFLGKIVGFRYGGLVAFGEYVRALEVEGIEKPNDLPNPPSDEDALNRAVHDLCMARSGRQFKSVRMADGGWTIKHAKETKDDEHRSDVDLSKMVLRCWVNKAEQLKFAPSGHPLIPQMKTWFRLYQTHMHPDDVSRYWIHGILKGRDRTHLETAVSVLRERGGVYYVPKDGVPLLQKVINATHAVTAHKINTISAFQSDSEAVVTILDGIASEAEQMLGKLHADLAKTGKSALGKGALKSRKEAVSNFEAKVAALEKLLGSPVAGLAQKLADAKARIEGSRATRQAAASMAMLAAEDEVEHGS